MTSIRDVARLAGVSVGTVSHFVNGTARVSPEKAARVREAIRELNYQPHAVARQLATRRARAIGVVCKIANLTGPEIIAGVQEVAWQNGYSVLLHDAHSDPALNARYFDLLTAGLVDGLLVLTAQVNLRDIQRVHRLGKPLVVWNFPRTPHFDVPSVNADWRAGTTLAVRHLLDTGHRRIGLLCGPNTSWTVRHRAQGYSDALAAAGLPTVPELVVGDDYGFAGGVRAMRALLALDEPPTAVVAMHDLAAVGAANAILDSGRRIPADIAVVGFDDTLIASTFRPSLTSVRVPKRQIGVTAAEMLLRLIEEEDEVPSRTIVPLDLVVRESSGGARTVEELAALGD